MLLLKYSLTLYFLLVSFFSAWSQSTNPITEKLAEQLQSLAKQSPAELIYIQTSKDIYETMEDLWFKAYVLNAQIFSPSERSQTLYLEMLNEKTKQVVWQEKYPVQNGFAEGHVYINDTLSEGNYLLAAYTPYSVYGDSTGMKAIRRIVVKKEIKVNYNANKEPASDPSPVKSEPIQFTTFPEGGQLVSGLPCRLGFKAVNKQGMPLDIKGALYEDNTASVPFQSVHAGMGSLIFTPVPGRKYHIRLSEPAQDSIFPLPTIYPERITLQLTGRDKETLEFKIMQSPTIEKRKIYLRGQVRGVVYCIASANLSNELKIKIPLKEFPCQGIAEFTLFTDSLRPVAERLVYVNPGRKLTIETQLDKERYETRGKVTLKITAKDEKGQPAIVNLGINVYDKLYRVPNNPLNILTHCFLSSQLKGRIYDPTYYFDPQNQNREEALDLLMLTQGWRRYVWSEPLLKENQSARHQIIFDGVPGEVHATRNKKSAKGIQQFVKAFYLDNSKGMDMLMPDSSGNFTITPEVLQIGQGGYVYLKPLLPDEFRPRVHLSDPFETIHSLGTTKEIDYPLSGIPAVKKDIPEKDFVDGRTSIKLAEVKIKGHGIVTFRDKFIGQLDSMAKDEICFDYVSRCGHLNCPVHEYDHEGNKKPVDGKTYLRYVGFKWLDDGNSARGRAYSVNGEESVVYHYPKYTESELLEKFNFSRIKGYYAHREFYQPKYDNVDSLNDPLPDYRNTLLWTPSVMTNEKGEATVSFFCSDINTGFVGSIEGANSEGLLGSKGFEFFVLRRKQVKTGK